MNPTFDACACGAPSMSITVNWSSDGTATVNGESCGAWCVGGPPDHRAGLCRDLGLPVVDGQCNVQIGCCLPVPVYDAGLPVCGTNSDTIIGLGFTAETGQQPRGVMMSLAYAPNDPGCLCSYCSADFQGPCR
jgi:hypothetical protein